MMLSAPSGSIVQGMWVMRPLARMVRARPSRRARCPFTDIVACGAGSQHGHDRDQISSAREGQPVLDALADQIPLISKARLNFGQFGSNVALERNHVD